MKNNVSARQGLHGMYQPKVMSHNVSGVRSERPGYGPEGGHAPIVGHTGHGAVMGKGPYGKVGTPTEGPIKPRNIPQRGHASQGGGVYSGGRGRGMVGGGASEHKVDLSLSGPVGKGVTHSSPAPRVQRSTYRGKSTKPGGGGRFAKMVSELKGKVRNPAAVAASIGRKKYGAKKMARFAAAGRKRAR